MTSIELMEVFRAACARVDLARRVARALAEEEGPLVVLAVGKAARAMLEGARGLDVRSALLVTSEAVATDAMPNVRALVASHPLPDASSIAAAEAALALAADPTPGTRIFLISGGASSLLCAPAPGVDLARKRAVTSSLLRADASIREINIVRRHLSRIKGGGLARAAAAHARRTLVVSDVVGGRPEDVGSGPSLSDATTIADATAIAARFALGELPWVETLKTPEPSEVLADAAAFANLFADELSQRGLRVVVGVRPDTDMNALVEEYALVAASLTPGSALVIAAEPRLRVPDEAGHGGRNTHLATHMSLRLPAAGVTFASIATDGVDGTSGTAGAIVNAPLTGAEDALAQFDTGPLVTATNTAFPLSPSGLNFADLHVLLKLAT